MELTEQRLAQRAAALARAKHTRADLVTAQAYFFGQIANELEAGARKELLNGVHEGPDAAKAYHDHAAIHHQAAWNYRTHVLQDTSRCDEHAHMRDFHRAAIERIDREGQQIAHAIAEAFAALGSHE